MFHKIVIRILVLLMLPAAARAAGDGEPVENFSLGTGGQSGIYYPFGGAVAELWSEQVEGINVKAEVTAASVENTIKVASGSMLAGFAQANVVEQAYMGSGQFEEKLPVRVLMTLYPNLLHVILPRDTDIRSLKDLAGRRVSLGAPASGTAVTAENILQANGVGVEDMDARYLNYSETTNALANNQIDAGFIVGGLGVGAVTELALTKDITLLSISDAEIYNFRTGQPIYNVFDVPEGAYNNVDAFRTVAVWNVIVVHKDMDEDMAYQLAKVVYESGDSLVRTQNAARFTTLENAFMADTIPLHPGALRYIDEMK